jgi:hypothetical protein
MNTCCQLHLGTMDLERMEIIMFVLNSEGVISRYRGDGAVLGGLFR